MDTCLGITMVGVGITTIGIYNVINAVFESGEYPVPWSQTAIPAVFEKDGSKDKYRGIAVG